MAEMLLGPETQHMTPESEDVPRMYRLDDEPCPGCGGLLEYTGKVERISQPDGREPVTIYPYTCGTEGCAEVVG